MERRVHHVNVSERLGRFAARFLSSHSIAMGSICHIVAELRVIWPYLPPAIGVLISYQSVRQPMFGFRTDLFVFLCKKLKWGVNFTNMEIRICGFIPQLRVIRLFACYLLIYNYDSPSNGFPVFASRLTDKSIVGPKAQDSGHLVGGHFHLLLSAFTPEDAVLFDLVDYITHSADTGTSTDPWRTSEGLVLAGLFAARRAK